ncbi:MAG: class I SAM-dependent methyltransferase [Chloroflexi bacterium]|nr:class I SAM-dependent methyltransferase [Chloroflexota bacterium]
MEIITRRGPRTMDAAEFNEQRARYASTLIDLGTGDGAWPRRFAREHANVLAVGVDSDRDALREAAKLAERKPARGGAANAIFVAASAESLPPELRESADWVTIYFPWSALLRMILAGDDRLGELLYFLCPARSRVSIVLNAEAPPAGVEPPTPASVRGSLESPLSAAGFRITRSERLEASQAPPTTWGGRLVKGSGRAMIGLDATR